MAAATEFLWGKAPLLDGFCQNLAADHDPAAPEGSSGVQCCHSGSRISSSDMELPPSAPIAAHLAIVTTIAAAACRAGQKHSTRSGSPSIWSSLILF